VQLRHERRRRVPEGPRQRPGGGLQGDGATVASPAAGYYKVSTSGDVQGVAQCLGDIAAADCPACLAQAVEQLKGTCGNAVAADVYLAKCSVRYWENGNYFRSSQGSCLQIQWHTIMNALIIITIRSSTFLEAETESFLAIPTRSEMLHFLLKEGASFDII
jgi:hypothetical protein